MKERVPEIIFHPDVLSEACKISVNPYACGEVLVNAGVEPNKVDKIKIVIGGRSSRSFLGEYISGEIIVYSGTSLDRIAVDPLNPWSGAQEIEEMQKSLERDLNKTLAHESKHAAEDRRSNNPLKSIHAWILNKMTGNGKWKIRAEERRARAFEHQFNFPGELAPIAVLI